MAAIDPQTDAAKAAMDDMLSTIECAETDAAVWMAKFEGKWPGYESCAGEPP